MKSSADAAAVHTGDPDVDLDENLDENETFVELADLEAVEPAADAEDSGDEDEDSARADEPEKPARRWTCGWKRARSKLKTRAASGNDAAVTPEPRRGNSVLRGVAAAVLALVLAGAGYEGWILYQHHQQDVAATQALEAAKKFALALTSVDPNSIDKNFADVLDGATGQFKDMYTQSSEQLRQLLIQNKAAAHGTVIEAAVKSATKNKVEVVLFIDQSVSNAAVPGPQLDRSRVTMTMEKVGDRWLASKVEMP